jgi:hypothetical protein
MSQVPPPVVNQPPRPYSPRSGTPVFLITAILALIAIVAVAAFILLRPAPPNLRPDTYPPSVVSRVGDGWLDMRFEDLGVIVRVPGRPSTQVRRYEGAGFNPAFASDYIDYACTGDKCIVQVRGIWLTPAAAREFEVPGALAWHCDDNFGKGANPVDGVDGLPPGAEVRHTNFSAPGYPPGNQVYVTLMRKKDLMLYIMVSTDGTKQDAIERIEKAFAGFRLDPPSLQ